MVDIFVCIVCFDTYLLLVWVKTEGKQVNFTKFESILDNYLCMEY